MPQRLKLLVAYDGTPFAGWQSQAGGNTVQDHLERAFAGVVGKHERMHGAGRTDAGVHALAQCAHIDLPDGLLPEERWPGALNAALPPTIRVLRCRFAPQSFHARFSAKGKVYRYRIWNDAILPPLEHGRAWHVHAPLDLETLAKAADQFVGSHDFAGFAANRSKPDENTVRTIKSVRVGRAGKCIALEISGDGFLYKMVRLMVGSLIRCARGRLAPADIGRRLAVPAATEPQQRFVAPASGLFLVRVRY